MIILLPRKRLGFEHGIDWGTVLQGVHLREAATKGSVPLLSKVVEETLQ